MTESFEISASASVGRVKLNVHSIERSLHFYHDLLGFQIIGKASNENVVLAPVGSNNNDHLIQLSRLHTPHIMIEGEQSTVQQAGLYHFAILLPSRKHLANIFKHLTEISNQVYFEGAADHLVSESLYLRDPDFNGVEIYRDREQMAWKRSGQFQVEMKTDHLNLEQLLGEAEDDEKWHMPSKTVIGHVHLHVSNLINSKKFYSKILGLHHTCSYPGANFFAADSYHHHIATNTWLGNEIANADTRQPGLDHFALKLDHKEDFVELLHHIQGMKIKVLTDDSNKVNKKSFFVLDPDNIKIQVYIQ